MKFTVSLAKLVLFALSIHASTASTSSESEQGLADSGTDQVPPIGFPPVKIPAAADNANLPLNVQFDTEGDAIAVGLHSDEASHSQTPSGLPETPSPIRPAASSIGPCDTANEARCRAAKEKGANSCSSSSLGTACNAAQGAACSTEALDACIDFTGANGIYCSAFGCAQNLDY